MINAAETATLKPGLAEAILSEISEEEIVKMARDVIEIPSPTGEERRWAGICAPPWKRPACVSLVRRWNLGVPTSSVYGRERATARA